MRKRKVIPMLVAVMLLCAMTVSAAAVSLVEPAAIKRESQLSARELSELPERPEVTVEGNLVTNDGGKTHTGYFELSLRVSAKAFQSAGVVLAYDNTVLHPVDWQSTGVRIDLTKKQSWDTSAAVHTKGADGLAGKPALTYAEYTTVDGEDTATGKAYLYLGADSLEYTPLQDERVVTVRFEVEKDDAGNLLAIDMPAADVSRPSYTVELAKKAAILSGSIPGASLLTSAGPGEDSGSQEPVFYSSADDAAYTVTFVRADGPSVDRGGSTASGDYAITFFDWDGRVIDAIAAPENAEQAVSDWQQHSVIEARLKNKPGYEFDQWLVVYEDNDGEGLHTAGGTFTSNNAALDLTDATVRADVADLSNISGYVNKKDPESKSVLLQASYKATADINTGVSGAAASHYTVKPIAYTRYGGATADDGKYSITLEVRRLNSADMGVTRARTPGVIVKMQPTAAGSQPIFTLLSLENTDVTTCEMVPNKQIRSVEYYFIDAATSPGNWPGAGNLSPLNVKIDQTGENGFIRLGTVGYINQQARGLTAPEFASAVDHQTFLDAGLNYSGPGIVLARTRMYNAVRASSADLTKAQLQAAIGNSAYN